MYIDLPTTIKKIKHTIIGKANSTLLLKLTHS